MKAYATGAAIGLALFASLARWYLRGTGRAG